MLTPKLQQRIDPFPRLFLGPEAREVIERETWNSPLAETGGILVGHIEPPFSIHITAASGPGPNARCTSSYFLRDTAWCSAFLQQQYESSGADYLGDWHSHLSSVASDELSSGDLVTLLQNAHDPDYADLPGFTKILALRQTRAGSSIPENEAEPINVRLKGFVATRKYIIESQIEDV